MKGIKKKIIQKLRISTRKKKTSTSEEAVNGSDTSYKVSRGIRQRMRSSAILVMTWCESYLYINSGGLVHGGKVKGLEESIVGYCIKI